jgi:hypothetical protein
VSLKMNIMEECTRNLSFWGAHGQKLRCVEVGVFVWRKCQKTFSTIKSGYFLTSCENMVLRKVKELTRTFQGHIVGPCGSSMVLRRAPGKVAFRACFPRLETKISVRPLVRVWRPRSAHSPMGAKERAHSGVVHAQPPPRGATWVGRDRGGGGGAAPPGSVHAVSLL